MSKATSRYSDDELAEFKTLIEAKLEKAKQQLASTQGQLEDLTENTDDDFGTDMIDDSSISDSIGLLSSMVSRQKKHISDLENALIRIRNKSYGICVVSGQLIDKKRLRAVLTTTKSLAAKIQAPIAPSKSASTQDDDDDEDMPKKKVAAKPTTPKIITKIIRKPKPGTTPAPKSLIDDDLDEDDDDLDLEDDLIDLSGADYDDEDDDLSEESSQDIDFDEIVDKDSEDNY